MTQITIAIPDVIWRRVLSHYGLIGDHDLGTNVAGTPADTADAGTEAAP